VVVHDGGDDGVVDGEQSEGCSDAIGPVPKRGGGEEVRGKETEVVRVPEGCKQRRRGSQ
jgi:hypothetical protein